MAFAAFEVSQTIAAQFGGCQDFNGNDDTLLHSVAYEGNVKVMEEILSRRPSGEVINQRNHLGCSPLRLAATGGHTACVEKLLDGGASVDVPDVKGQTPLQVAVTNQHYACAKLLLERGANPNGDSNNRSTPLSLAALNGRCDLVQLLLDYKAEIMIQRASATGQLFTVDPLQMAIAYQHFQCSKMLLAEGAEPLYAPYHTLMMQRGHLSFAQLLYEFGTRLWARDRAGRYPWEVAPHPARDDEEESESQALLGFLEKLKGHPRSLRSSCRLAVWRQIRSVKRTAAALNHLPHVPQAVIQYLSFELL